MPAASWGMLNSPQAANTVLRSSGGVPAWGPLQAADIPTIAQSQVSGLPASLGLLAPLASPSFTGPVGVAAGGAVNQYNTADQTTNYERLHLGFAGNVAQIGAEFSGTGSARNLQFGVNGYSRTLTLATNFPSFNITPGVTSGNGNMTQIGGTSTTTNSSYNSLALVNTYNQTNTAGSADLYMQRIETALGSGAHYFINCFGGAAGANQNFYVTNSGTLFASGQLSSPIFRSPAGVTTVLQNQNFTAAGNMVNIATGTATNSTGTVVGASVQPTFSTTGTAGWVGLQVATTASGDTATGTKYPLNVTHNSTQLLYVDGASSNVYMPAGQVVSQGISSVNNGNALILNNRSYSSTTAVGVTAAAGIYSNASGTSIPFQIAPTFSTSGTGGWTALNVNVTSTSDAGSGTKNLFDFYSPTLTTRATLNAGNGSVQRVVRPRIGRHLLPADRIEFRKQQRSVSSCERQS